MDVKYVESSHAVARIERSGCQGRIESPVSAREPIARRKPERFGLVDSKVATRVIDSRCEEERSSLTQAQSGST